jgi:di/tricarboxylate transporter
MTPAIVIVFVLIAVALVLFTVEVIPAEMVALGLLLAFVMTGILTPEQAFAGFASDTVMMILGLLIMTSAIARTGVMGGVARWLQIATKGRKLLFTSLLLGSVTALSSFMSNTAVTALFVPVVIAVSRRMGLPVHSILLPVAFASILAGSMTLIGTSTNLVVSGLMQTGGLAPLDMFEMTPVGLVLVLLGVPYLIFLAPRLLPSRSRETTMEEVIRAGHYLTEVRVQKESLLVGKTLREARFGEQHDLNVLSVIRESGEQTTGRANTKLRAGDVLLVEGPHDAILKVKDQSGLEIKAEAKLGAVAPENESPLTKDDDRVVEALVLPRSTLLHQTLKQARFRERYGVIALGIRRHGENLLSKISQVPLKVGDLLLLQGSTSDLRALEDAGAFRLIGEADTSRFSKARTLAACAIFVGVLALGVFKVLSLPVAALTGAFLIFATRCASPEETYREMEWKAIILIACMLSVGAALHTSGADAYVGGLLAGWAGSVTPVWILAGIFVFTVALSQPMSNQAAAALVLPIALQTATQLGLDARPFAMTVAFAAGCSFLTPLEPSCLMVYGPGGYRFKDFLIAGLPLTLIVMVVTLVMVPVIWPLHPR